MTRVHHGVHGQHRVGGGEAERSDRVHIGRGDGAARRVQRAEHAGVVHHREPPQPGLFLEQLAPTRGVGERQRSEHLVHGRNDEIVAIGHVLVQPTGSDAEPAGDGGNRQVLMCGDTVAPPSVTATHRTGAGQALGLSSTMISLCQRCSFRVSPPSTATGRRRTRRATRRDRGVLIGRRPLGDETATQAGPVFPSEDTMGSATWRPRAAAARQRSRSALAMTVAWTLSATARWPAS